MDQTDNLIDQETVGKDRVLPGIGFFETATDDLAAILQNGFEVFKDFRTLFEGCQIRIGSDGFKLGKDFASVDDFALFLDSIRHLKWFPRSGLA